MKPFVRNDEDMRFMAEQGKPYLIAVLRNPGSVSTQMAK